MRADGDDDDEVNRIDALRAVIIYLVTTLPLVLLTHFGDGGSK